MNAIIIQSPQQSQQPIWFDTKPLMECLHHEFLRNQSVRFCILHVIMTENSYRHQIFARSKWKVWNFLRALIRMRRDIPFIHACVDFSLCVSLTSLAILSLIYNALLMFLNHWKFTFSCALTVIELCSFDNYVPPLIPLFSREIHQFARYSSMFELAKLVFGWTAMLVIAFSVVGCKNNNCGLTKVYYFDCFEALKATQCLKFWYPVTRHHGLRVYRRHHVHRSDRRHQLYRILCANIFYKNLKFDAKLRNCTFMC